MIFYYISCGVLSIGVLIGISLMSKVKTAVIGNALSSFCVALAIALTMYVNNILDVWVIYLCMAIGLVIGLVWTAKVKMIQMPQVVALFNGIGGLASAIVGIFAMLNYTESIFSNATAGLALAIGMITFTGSLIAAGKLAKVINQKPIVLKFHKTLTALCLMLVIAAIVVYCIIDVPTYIMMLVVLVLGSLFGIVFSIRVGGADMPITISLLNSLSGVAGSIAGMATNDYLLVAVGGIVGASGLLLTQIMCKAMNRSLFDILLGKKPSKPQTTEQPTTATVGAAIDEPIEDTPKIDYLTTLKTAKKVLIVPGYGMALAQAQHLVKQLTDKLESNGTEVKFAIHPVAGRMPGHMNVLLCEADLPYEKLFEMDQVNDEFKLTDCTIVIGANDVINPAARNAEGTPIYGMPVLSVDECKNIIIMNYDLKPGYAGVENPLYTRKSGVTLLLGNASDTLQNVISELK